MVYVDFISYNAIVWPLIFKTIPFTDVKCVLILILKLPHGSNTKASNFTSLRLVLPKIEKWLLLVWKVGWQPFQKTNCVCRFYFQLSYGAIVWPLIYGITTSTDVILCAKLGFKATTGKQQNLWLTNFLTFAQPVKSFLKINLCTFLLMAFISILVLIIRLIKVISQW